MIQRVLIIVIFLLPFFCQAQRDVLVLQRRGMHERAYTVGDPFVFETIYGQWFSGTIEDLRHDTIYIAGQAFNYNEIAAIKRSSKSGWTAAGKYMLIIGGGFAAISVFNGLKREDHPNQWFTTTGYIIGGALIAGGFVATFFTPKYYRLGGRFKLTYLQITK